MYPRSAYLLGLVGGVLIVIYALYEVVAAFVFTRRIESILPGATRLLVILGVLGVVLGFLIIVFALRLRSSPGSVRTSGALMIVWSLLSFVAGGGLFIGLILAFIGGIMAITWRPPTFHPTMYGRPGYDTPIRQPAGPIPWETTSSPPIQPGVAERFCRSCGAPNVPSAQFCAKCGASMS